MDASTLEKKLIMGYQGWFGSPQDRLGTNLWWHWFRDNSSPDASNLVVDMWPDSLEFRPDELCRTNLTYSNGQPVFLYSCSNTSVIDRHFSWMQYNNLDGIMLQRFVCEIHDQQSVFKNFRDQVTRNVMTSAEAHGRVFVIMYDISGYNGTSLVKDIISDWSYLVGDLKITASKSYLHHNKKPLLAIWGMGFKDPDPNSTTDPYPATPNDALNLIQYFQKNNVTVMGGVPFQWRTLDSPDLKQDKAWTAVYQSFDIISPWSVGKYELRMRMILARLTSTNSLG